VHAARHAAARLEQTTRQHVDAGAEIQRCDPADFVEAERLRAKYALLTGDPPRSRAQLR
jgi:hypothetical protein